jgi:predicted nuclease of restriction endonuclease-like RecB superfamily
MLPSQLLRIKTRKGEIIPLFTGGENKSGHSELVKIIINEFEESAANKEKKKTLNERISLLERDFDDYRLVRGLSTLLERRCKFIPAISQSDENCKEIICPADIRKQLWEESSRRGFALTPTRRDEIVNAISARTTNSATSIIQSMWSDLDENMILERFDSVKSDELLGWYDLSLLQTLLFTCTSLQFSVKGGASWKNILRKVKRLGLMYNLKELVTSDKSPDFNDSASELVCSIDGPVSLFKMTDRYGTSIAKLIPFIISSSWWHLSALIVRKTVSGKKIYEFKASSADFRQLNLREPSQNEQDNSIDNRPSSSYYDSSLEEKFAIRFEHLANRWKIKREPEPLIVGNGVAFIPDFLFEKYGRKVYLEIVGFWTKEYLEKKFQKINDILRNSNIDLFVAVDEELSCSKLFSSTTLDPSNSRIIYFKKASVPVKKLQEHLKSIDNLQIASNISNSDLRIRFNGTKDVISIEEISEAYGVPIEIATAIASRDNSMDYLRINSWFLLKSKVMGLAELLTSTTKFTEACAILSKNSIPEACHAELVSILGFDVVWQSMNSDDTMIVKRP